jgi:4-amino-4-deoxy-L-arabinose transferase-like glycosyltransferase
MIYGPVYFYLSVAAAALIGDSYAPMRLVSLLASLGTILVIGRLVQRETSSMGAALVAGGLYAATFYQATGGRPTTSRHVPRRSARSCRRAMAGAR